MAAVLEILESSIIALGDFNPSIFSPDWVERNQLIGPEDAETGRQDENLIVSKQASRFATDWFNLQVLPSQFSITSKGPLSPSITDLAIGILTVVWHTPITALGLNFMAHYKTTDTNDRHVIGDKLAPKDIWKQLFPQEESSIGLNDLQMVVEPYRRGEIADSGDRKRITVQPSARVKDGVFFAFNDHYAIKAKDPLVETSAQIAVQLIDERWQLAWNESAAVFSGLLEYCLGGKT